LAQLTAVEQSPASSRTYLRFGVDALAALIAETGGIEGPVFANRDGRKPSIGTPLESGDGKYQLMCVSGSVQRAFPLDVGAPEGIRTPNLLIRSQMLYPLSYGRTSLSYVADESASAEARGFEPPVAFEGDNSLAVSPIRPLWHAS
jgi:hypothetical protein